MLTIPLLVFVAGLVSASGCQIDCWDQSVGLWAFTSILTAPGVLVGAWLLRVRGHGAMWAALAVATLLYISLGFGFFMGWT